MLPEGYLALAGIVVLLVISLVGLFKVIDDAQAERLVATEMRLTWRKNANELIKALCREDNPISRLMLRTALAVTLDEYRSY